MKKYLNQVKIEEELQNRIERVAKEEGFATNASFIRYAIVQTIKGFEGEYMEIADTDLETSLDKSFNDIQAGNTVLVDPHDEKSMEKTLGEFAKNV